MWKFTRDLGALREILLFLLNSTEIPSQTLMVSSSMAHVAIVVDVAMHEDVSPFEPTSDKIFYHFQVFNYCLDCDYEELSGCLTLHIRTLRRGSAKGMIHKLLGDIPSLGYL